MQVEVEVDFQSRAGQGRADHEGQVTGGTHQRSRERQGKAHHSHRAADIARLYFRTVATRLSVALFNFSSMQECLQACSTSTSAHGHCALIVGKPRGKTWMLFPRRAAEELQPSANEA
jgi:hypothetical protein